MTPGVQALGEDGVMAILQAVRDFDDFTPDNDPYGEADFGSITYQGLTIFWKVDAYDKDLMYASPDPSDPAVTSRVLTIMLSSEY